MLAIRGRRAARAEADAMVVTDSVMLEARASALSKRSIKAASKVAGIRLAISCTDLTTLEGKDSEGRVRSLCAKAVRPSLQADIPSVAAVCVYPNLVAVAKACVAGSGVRVASVATAFPSGLSSLEVKLADVRAAKATRVELRLSAEQATQDKLAELKALFVKHPGSCSAALSITLPGTAETRISLKGTRVAPSDDLLAAVERLFGGKVAQVR